MNKELPLKLNCCPDYIQWFSPSDVKLHMRIKQGDDRCRSGPPAADSGPDQPLLLVMADHLDEPWPVLSVGLLHKALQVVFELPCEKWQTQKLIVCLYGMPQWSTRTFHEPSLRKNTIKSSPGQAEWSKMLDLHKYNCLKSRLSSRDWQNMLFGFSGNCNWNKKINTELNISRPEEERNGKKTTLLSLFTAAGRQESKSGLP